MSLSLTIGKADKKLGNNMLSNIFNIKAKQMFIKFMLPVCN